MEIEILLLSFLLKTTKRSKNLRLNKIPNTALPYLQGTHLQTIMSAMIICSLYHNLLFPLRALDDKTAVTYYTTQLHRLQNQ